MFGHVRLLCTKQAMVITLGYFILEGENDGKELGYWSPLKYAVV